MSSAKNQKGLSASSVREDLRIRFTEQLLQLREDEVTEVTFSNELSNVERKFLHALAQELGLKSKSRGKGDDRFITVTKPNGKISDSASIFFDVMEETKHVLLPLVYDIPKTPKKKKRRSRMVPPRHSEKSSQQEACSMSAVGHFIDRQTLRESNPDYNRLQTMRRSLPASEHCDAVTAMIKQNRIVLISGETGCGKTTQVPQFLLDDPEIGPTCRIAVSQPRRISAVTVSDRIAHERSESIGDVVGYNIRLESECGPNTKVHFMTPGVLLRMVQEDPTLSQWTHIIIDEAHERDRYTEFLFIILRDLILSRASTSGVRLVLMSATMHTQKLSNYFGGIPHVHIGSSMFPVEEFYLEHVLRFVGYSDSLNKQSSRSGVVSTEEKRVFKCPICNSATTVFLSVVELGSHVAMCNGVDAGPPVEDIAALSLKEVTLPEHVDEEGEEIDEGEQSQGEGDEALCGYEEEVEDGELSRPLVTLSAYSSTSGGSGCTDISKSDEELVRRYQQSWDDSLVDLELICSLMRYVFRSEFSKSHGTVLVFLPGWDDISKLKTMLSGTDDFGDTRRYCIVQLHSGIPKQAQREVFRPVPHGVHKIVLSTNIAETSVTIDNVTVVIDTGRVKEKSYDPHTKLSCLKAGWVSQSSARQRKGRAGRTRAGVVFRLYSSRRYESLPSFQDSELLRSSLEELVLHAKLMGLAPGQGEAARDGVHAFLLKAMDPPHVLAVTNAVDLLKAIRCLDENEAVTPLGEALCQLPVEPCMGRVLLLGALFGALPSMLRVSCSMGYRDPFVMPISDQQRAIQNKVKLRFSNGVPADQVVVLNALCSYEATKHRGEGSATRFCDDNFLSRSTMGFVGDLHRQVARCLENVTGISSHKHQHTRRNNDSTPLQCALIGIGLCSSVAIRRKGTKTFLTEKGVKAKVHPSSINKLHGSVSCFPDVCSKNIELVGYQELVAAVGGPSLPGSASLMMLSTCPLSVFTYLLSCGSLVLSDIATNDDVDNAEELSALAEMVDVTVDDWLQLRTPRQTANLIVRLRECLYDALCCYLGRPTEPLPPHVSAMVDGVVAAFGLEHFAAGTSLQTGNSRTRATAAMASRKVAESRDKHQMKLLQHQQTPTAQVASGPVGATSKKSSKKRK